MRTVRARAIVATLCLVALLLALALPFSGGLAAALVPALPGVALLQETGPPSATPDARPRAALVRNPAARGPPPVA